MSQNANNVKFAGNIKVWQKYRAIIRASNRIRADSSIFILVNPLAVRYTQVHSLFELSAYGNAEEAARNPVTSFAFPDVLYQLCFTYRKLNVQNEMKKCAIAVRAFTLFTIWK